MSYLYVKRIRKSSINIKKENTGVKKLQRIFWGNWVECINKAKNYFKIKIYNKFEEAGFDLEKRRK